MAQTDPADLASQTCVPCRGGVLPLSPESIGTLMTGLSGEWHVAEGKRLEREFRFTNFRRAMSFTQAIGAIAEEQQHHPDLCLGWGYVRVTLLTHAIGGLHQNDFILAARIDALPKA
jgi:4a-hydroxytetrahydrobiopterin dehydratase